MNTPHITTCLFVMALLSQLPPAVAKDYKEQFRRIEEWATELEKDTNTQNTAEANLGKYSGIVAEGPLPPVNEAVFLSKTNTTVKLSFYAAPLAQVTSFYTQMSGMSVLGEEAFTPSITFMPSARYSVRQALIVITQVLEAEGIVLERVDEHTVRLRRRNIEP